MRLAFLTHEPFHPPSGGGSAEAPYLVREFVRRGHRLVLFCPSFPDAGTVGREFGIDLRLFTRWAMGRYTTLRNLKYLAYPSFVRRMVTKEHRMAGFDLCFSQHAISAVAAGGLKRALRLPVVMNFLDYLTGFMETWPPCIAPRPVIRALERYEINLPRRCGADGVLAVSDTLADLLAETGYPRERIRPIYYGYDSGRFPPRPAGSTNPGRPPVAVMHGSFDQHHLGPIALEGLQVAASLAPGLRFRFVGKQTPALIRFQREAGRFLGSDRIECTGFVPYDTIASSLADADVGIVPYEESTGTHCAFVAKIVEYLGVGLPVVSTPLNSAKRYFGNEPAVRFSEFDGKSFGKAISDWLKEPPEKRFELGRAAGLKVASRLDWGVIARNAVDFVEEIAQQGRT